LPVIRTFISLPAGIAKMNFTRFCILSFLGSLIWSLFLTYVGFALGKNWHSLETYYRKFEYAIIAVIVLAAAYYIWHKIKSARKK
jgi:membrane protein DedA with SNARE-associated domain